MNIYKTCPDCDANLDPDERCDCQEKQMIPKKPEELEKIRVCSALLPPPGETVVVELLDEIKLLHELLNMERNTNNALRGVNRHLQADIEKLEKVQADIRRALHIPDSYQL